MATITLATRIGEKEIISQGDVFRDVKYNYIDLEKDDVIEVIEYVFPMAIIISQACDVGYMGAMIDSKQGKATKFMPSILMCPIYDSPIAKSTKHVDEAFRKLEIKKIEVKNEWLFKSEEISLAKNDWHYRYHPLTIRMGKDTILDNALIDFKHYFSVPASYLMRNRDKRLFRLNDLYAEQVTLKFAACLSRVGTPDFEKNEEKKGQVEKDK